MEQRGGGDDPGHGGRQLTVEVVVPLGRGDHATVIHCLSSLQQQTVTPRRVVLVDDGGSERDHALQLAREFARANGVELEGIARRWSIGHVATLKRQARESDADVLLVLEPTTILESPGYLQACLDALAVTAGVAGACGRTGALSPAQRRHMEASAPFRRWVGLDGYRDPLEPRGLPARLQAWWATAVLAHFLRLGIELPDRQSMRSCGTIALPFGGAVAYRRRYLQDLFDRVEPVRGDDLGAWPGHVIAHALATEGYRIVRLDGIGARMQPLPLSQLPRRAWAWLVGWLQAGYWFDPLMRSPFRFMAGLPQRRPVPAQGGGRQVAGRRTGERRIVDEAFREPFGERITRLQGRPVGRYLLLRILGFSAISVLAWVLAVLGEWGALGILVVVETMAATAVSVVGVAPGRRAATALHALVAAPWRWGALLIMPVAMLRVASGVWLDRGFRWRRSAPVQRGRRPARGD